MKTINVLGTILCLLVLTGTACEYFKPDNFPTPDCTLDTPFWLEYGASTDCADLSVTFTGEVQDSRCPITVTCVWEGRVDVEVQIGDELVALGLPDDEQLGASKATVGNYLVELLDVFPAPITADEIPEESYRIKLKISDL